MAAKKTADILASIKSELRPSLITSSQSGLLAQYHERYQEIHNGEFPPPEQEAQFVRQLIDSQKPIKEAEELLNEVEKQIKSILKHRGFRFYIDSFFTLIILESLGRYVFLIHTMYKSNSGILFWDSFNFVASALAIIYLIVSLVISERKRNA